jgi:protein-disulfide isomerase
VPAYTRDACLLPIVLALALAACAAPEAGEPAVAATSQPGATATATATAPSDAPASQDYKVLGREDAPVTIIEFTDLQCPYCARFARETFPKLKATYIDTGRVRFASTDLPLAMHAFAVPAAIAARCAGEQGHYWAYRDRLFAAQDRLGSEPYAGIATSLGLDAERFSACRADPRQTAAVRADVRRAAGFGITSTPTFVIGRLVDGQFQGQTVSGAKSYEEFAARIEALLTER